MILRLIRQRKLLNKILLHPSYWGAVLLRVMAQYCKFVLGVKISKFFTETSDTLNCKHLSKPLLQKFKNEPMKSLTAALFALVVSAPLVLADGCNCHSEDVATACATGQSWDANAKQCVDTNA